MEHIKRNPDEVAFPSWDIEELLSAHGVNNPGITQRELRKIAARVWVDFNGHIEVNQAVKELNYAVKRHFEKRATDRIEKDLKEKMKFIIENDHG